MNADFFGMFRYCLCGLVTLVVFSSCSSSRAPTRQVYEPVHGDSVLLRLGRQAVAPRKAPKAVHGMVQAGNRLQRKPYRYGGGHARVDDTGYDCSGTVSYVLIKAGLLRSPLTSKGFKEYGEPGAGKWVTIWAKHDHSFITIGGLRLGTGWVRDGDERGPRWKTRSRPTPGYVVRHPRGL